MPAPTDPNRERRVISPEVARRFLVLRHLLAPPRSLPPGPESVLAVVARLGSIQFDPLVIAGRNHDLVLHARVAGYRSADTDELLYERRVLFEALNKGLSILPVSELPWYRVTWDRHAEWHGQSTFVEHSEIVDHVLERIRAEGPLGASDFEARGEIDWYWRPTSSVRAILEALGEAGVLGIARRDGNIRRYDLAERLFADRGLPAGGDGAIPVHEQLRHKLLSRFRGHGLLGAAGSAELWLGTQRRLSDGTIDPAGPKRADLRDELVAAGELHPVRVEGLKRPERFIVTADLPFLAAAEAEVAAEAGPTFEGGVGRPGGFDPGVSLIAPLDPFAWDRDLLLDLFGFDYVWEVYVPEAKRRWGYYVLPILFGDRIVGRIEPRIDRKAGVVEIRAAWWEEGFRPLEAPGFAAAFADAIEAYRVFAGAQQVIAAPRALPRGLLPKPRRVASPSRRRSTT